MMESPSVWIPLQDTKIMHYTDNFFIINYILKQTLWKLKFDSYYCTVCLPAKLILLSLSGCWPVTAYLWLHATISSDMSIVWLRSRTIAFVPMEWFYMHIGLTGSAQLNVDCCWSVVGSQQRCVAFSRMMHCRIKPKVIIQKL